MMLVEEQKKNRLSVLKSARNNDERKRKRARAPDSLWDKLDYYDDLTDWKSISRRYFVIGAFDGALTILGVILGAYATGHINKAVVLGAGTGGGIALGISSFVGAYEAERVEAKLGKRYIERAMLHEVGGDQEKAHLFSMRFSSVIHGIAPLIAAFVPIIPFLALEPTTAMVFAIGITLALLFIVGAYLGTLTKESILKSGARLLLVGMGTAVICYLLGAVH